MSTKPRIAIVDDYEDTLEILDFNLTKCGFETQIFTTPQTALRHIKKENTDLILTDWLMPEINGLEFIQKLKSNPENKDIPVIMITCIDNETKIIEALNSHIDDYMIKPFKIDELILRVKKVLSETTLPKEDASTILYVDKDNYKIKMDNEDLNLSVSEFKVFNLLYNNSNIEVEKTNIQQELNGPEFAKIERIDEIVVAGLRKKLGEFADLVENVGATGYRFNLSNKTHPKFYIKNELRTDIPQLRMKS